VRVCVCACVRVCVCACVRVCVLCACESVFAHTRACECACALLQFENYDPVHLLSTGRTTFLGHVCGGCPSPVLHFVGPSRVCVFYATALWNQSPATDCACAVVPPRFRTGLYTAAGLMSRTVKMNHPGQWAKPPLVHAHLGVWTAGVVLTRCSVQCAVQGGWGLFWAPVALWYRTWHPLRPHLRGGHGMALAPAGVSAMLCARCDEL
jgi:hypothetical protein